MSVSYEHSSASSSHEHFPEKGYPAVVALSHIAIDSMQYRSEHSRSLEQAEKYRAIETLKALGVLIPLSEIHAYHGRAYWRDEAADWSVDPDFMNGSNDTGNSNVNTRPTLYTASEETAIEFAQARMAGKVKQKLLSNEETKGYYRLPDDEREQAFLVAAKGVTGDIHRIISSDPDALVLNTSFKFDDDKEGLQRYVGAMKTLLPRPSHAVPVAFGKEGEVAAIKEEVIKVFNEKRPKYGVGSRATYDDLAIETGSLTEKIAGGSNAMMKLMAQLSAAARLFVSNDQPIATESHAGQTSPINLEYVAEFFHDTHIVGMTQRVESATILKNIKIVTFFDLDKVNTEAKIASNRHEAYQTFGGIAELLTSSLHSDVQASTFLQALGDAYILPQRIIEHVSELPEYVDLIKADAGNWEGYTLGEHTETVLRNFDENFADVLPVQLLRPMRLMLVAHDLGKPIAVRQGDKGNQKKYNLAMAKRFYKDVGINDKTSTFLRSLIGDGQVYAHDAFIRKQSTGHQALEDYASRSLEVYMDEAPTSELVEAYIELSKMLLICDGGAYTTRAVTRKQDDSLYRNAGSFDNSFQTFRNDPRQRKLSLK